MFVVVFISGNRSQVEGRSITQEVDRDRARDSDGDKKEELVTWVRRTVILPRSTVVVGIAQCGRKKTM